MADITIRHGGSAHFMRPDAVYRTSVLQPFAGYQPPADVNAVAMMFTQAAERGMALNGLGGWGPWDRFKARVQAWVAERQARKFMSATVPADMPPPFVPKQPAALAGMPGAPIAVAGQISPHLATQMTGVMALVASRYGSGFPAAQATTLVQRSLNRRYP